MWLRKLGLHAAQLSMSNDHLLPPESTLLLINGFVSATKAQVSKFQNFSLLFENGLYPQLLLKFMGIILVVEIHVRSLTFDATKQAVRFKLVQSTRAHWMVWALVQHSRKNVLMLSDPEYKEHVPAALVAGSRSSSTALPEALNLVVSDFLPLLEAATELSSKSLVLLTKVVGFNLFALLGWRERSTTTEMWIVGEEVRRSPLLVIEFLSRHRPELLEVQQRRFHRTSMSL
mmetsp:Transcript_10149/g.23159  ORF Transcript_10149/g.23159 Transcript_10149/m.23159 type:complete len:231 (+) Transcript_10149:215-907(+)